MEQVRLPGLQIARAAAALSIAYFHSWHVTMSFPNDTAYPIHILREYGGFAVDFFFAISGFVICLVVTKSTFNPLQFIIRRAFRLYPLLIATSLILIYVNNHYLGWAPNISNWFIVYSMTLLPTNGYPFYDLGWSLQHELAFYVLASLIAPRFGLAGMIAFLSAGAVADHYLELPWYLHQYAFFYTNFIAGIAAFLAYPYLKRFGFMIPTAIGFGLLYLCTLITGRIAFPVGFFFLLVGFANMKFKPNSMTEKIGVLLGDASYSIYLIHALLFAFIYAKLQPPLPPIWSQEFIRFGAITTVCLLAIASWRLFESPMIRLGNFLTSARLDLRAAELVKN